MHAAQAALKSIIVAAAVAVRLAYARHIWRIFDFRAPARCLVHDDILVCRPAPLNMALAIGRPPRVIEDRMGIRILLLPEPSLRPHLRRPCRSRCQQRTARIGDRINAAIGNAMQRGLYMIAYLREKDGDFRRQPREFAFT